MLRRLSLVTLLLATLALNACGGTSENQSLEDHVRAVMAELPYDYKVLPERGTEDYVVLYASDGKRDVGRFVAVGLPARPHRCPTPPPELPAAYGIDTVTFSEAGKGSLCIAEVDHRVNPEGRKLAKMMIGHEVVLAVWERIYGAPACWADRSCASKASKE